jgi:PAS domain S-box-containing protein
MLSESISEEEAVLREYADRMLEAERIAHFGVFRWEIATGTVRWSDELHRIYGLEPGEFKGTVDAFLAFLHPDDRDAVWENVQRAIARREPFVFEERIRRKDAQERVLLSRGSPVIGPDGEVVAVVGVCHDVTERVQAQRALGLSERRMRAILDYSPSIVAVKDLDGRYLMSNAETGRVLGMNADEIVGRHCSELFPTLAERLRAADRLAAAEMEPVYDEAVLVRDGEEREYVTVTFALPDDDGRPIETCTIGTDVTERKQREAERRERAHWTERIRRTLEEGRMLVYAQPVVDLSGDAGFCELLVRKRQRSGDLLEPDGFLPAAERYGLIQSIDIWMVTRALELAPTEKSRCEPIGGDVVRRRGARRDCAAAPWLAEWGEPSYL